MSSIINGQVILNSVIFGTAGGPPPTPTPTPTPTATVGGGGGLVFNTNITVAGALDIIASADNNNVYVSCDNTDGLVTFVRDPSTGSLDAGTPTAVTTSYGMCISPDNKFLYAPDLPDSGNPLVHIYSRDLSTGRLTSAGSTSVYAGNLIRSQISPDGKFLYILNNTLHVISMFTRNLTTGALSSWYHYNGGGYSALTMSADGAYFYTGGPGNTSLQSLARNSTTGYWTATGSSASSGSYPVDMCLSPDGNNLYSINSPANTIDTFSVDSSTGAITAVSSLATGAVPTCMCITPDGTQVFVSVYNSTNGTSNSTIYYYSRNTSTGELTGNGILSPGSRISRMFITADGNNLYAASTYNNNVGIYTII